MQSKGRRAAVNQMRAAKFFSSALRAVIIPLRIYQQSFLRYLAMLTVANRNSLQWLLTGSLLRGVGFGTEGGLSQLQVLAPGDFLPFIYVTLSLQSS